MTLPQSAFISLYFYLLQFVFYHKASVLKRFQLLLYIVTQKYVIVLQHQPPAVVDQISLYWIVFSAEGVTFGNSWLTQTAQLSDATMNSVVDF